MASITSIGVGSGIDLESLVENIISAERDPTTNRLNLEQVKTESKISAMGSLRLTMGAFQDSLASLQDTDLFNSRTANSSDNALFTASASNSADLSSYAVEVYEMAQANKIASSASFTSSDDTVGSGTLTVGFKGEAGFDILVDAGDSLSDIRDAINSAGGNPGITASLLTVDAGMGDGSTVTKFIMTSNKTGDVGQINIAVDDDDNVDNDGTGLSQFFYDGNNLLDPNNQFAEVETAQDARIKVDGYTAYSSTNSFSSVIDDVTITLKKGADDILNPPSATLSISEDKSQATSAIETFVASYNELLIVFNTLTDYDSATGTSGLFTGDSSISSLEMGIRRVLNDSVDGASSDLNALSLIGVSTNRNGTISLDSEKLSDNINNRLSDMEALFSSSDGVATQLDALLETHLQSGGTFDTRKQSLDSTLREIDDQRADLNFRIDTIEQRYRSQFAALDILVSQLNSTGNFLTQQLDATAKIVNRDNS